MTSWTALKWESSEARSLKVRSQGLQWNMRAVLVMVVIEDLVLRGRAVVGRLREG